MNIANLVGFRLLFSTNENTLTAHKLFGVRVSQAKTLTAAEQQQNSSRIKPAYIAAA